jgi:hypothetical protein
MADRRQTEYLNEIGLPQLTGGLVGCLHGGAVLLENLLPNASAQLAAQWCALLVAGAVLWAGKKFKERLVFPAAVARDSLPSRVKPFLYWLSAGMALAVFVAMIASAGHGPRLEPRWVPSGFAIFFAILFLIAGPQQKSEPLTLYGAYVAWLAPFLWWLPAGNYERLSTMQLAMSAPLAIAGALRLNKYLSGDSSATE